MSEIQTQALLFDMDGVLVSSIASARRSWSAWARHYGIAGWETLEIPHGVRARDIVIQLKPDLDPDEGLKRIEDMEVEDTHDIVLLDGARDLLESLPQNRWTIVTSAGRRLMIARLKAAGLPLPKQMITAEMVTRGKPEPEPYLRGASLLGFAASECIVVEDAPSGVRAGKAAGARVLGISGTVEKAELHAAGADWVVSSLAQLKVRSADEKALTLEL